MKVFGGIETGGSKWECAIGTGPDDLRATETVPTTTPVETIGRAVAFFEREGPVDAIGIGSFGPVDGKPSSAELGPHHDHAEARLGEHGRRPGGAPPPLRSGCLRHGRQRGRARRAALGRGPGPRHLLLHHDRDGDRRRRHGRREPPPRFAASGVRASPDSPRRRRGSVSRCLPVPRRLLGRTRLRPRDRGALGAAAEELAGRNDVWELEAHYVALGLVCVICVLSPQRIVLGGGVGTAPGLLSRVRPRVVALLNGYLAAPAVTDEIDDYLVPPRLATRSGVLGAIALAEALSLRH